MEFLNREDERGRLNRLFRSKEAGLAIVWGRRRVGKSRLLLEWVKEHKGIYFVADESTAVLQRQLLATSIEPLLPGFATVKYPDWGSLFSRLAQDAQRIRWRGPLVIDELPYLIETSPEIASVLQRFVDREARDAGLILALCGSSQRMMHGAVLDASAPLFGRAHEILKLAPLSPKYLQEAFRLENARDVIAYFTVWGGIPRYWELTARMETSLIDCAVELALDPMGPLHDEPQRLLREERPPAISLRPILEAIGLGCHRLSEIAGRLGQASTSLARPLMRLREMDLIEREVPYGTLEKDTKRALYKIKDPFIRLWFELIAPRHSLVIQSSNARRRKLLLENMHQLCATTWEELCRKAAASLAEHQTGLLFGPSGRFWHGGGPEWDILTESYDQTLLLVGEAKWSRKTPTAAQVQHWLNELKVKGPPPIGLKKGCKVLYALFVPERPAQLVLPPDTVLFEAIDVISAV